MGNIISNTWNDYKVSIVSTASALAAGLSAAYFIPEIKGVLADSITVALPTIASLVLGKNVDKQRKAKEKLEEILFKADLSRETGVVEVDETGKVKNYIAGKGGVLEKLNFRARPGEDLKEKYSDLPPEVAEFMSSARDELLRRRDSAKKDKDSWKRFNSKKAYNGEDGEFSRSLKKKDTFGNDFIRTTYELDVFLGGDNNTIKIKARRLVDETGLEESSRQNKTQLDNLQPQVLMSLYENRKRSFDCRNALVTNALL